MPFAAAAETENKDRLGIVAHRSLSCEADHASCAPIELIAVALEIDDDDATRVLHGEPGVRQGGEPLLVLALWTASNHQQDSEHRQAGWTMSNRASGGTVSHC
jgi:hypothetical protein